MDVKPGYKLTEAGIIPNDWVADQLSDVANLEVGHAFSSRVFTEVQGIPLLRGENVGYGQANWKAMRRLPNKIALTFKSFWLEPGDIVIGMDRTFTQSGAKITLLKFDDCPCVLVQRVGRFVVKKCDSNYLWFVLSSSLYHEQLKKEQKGMDIPHLSREEILSPKIPMPPTKAEQEAIAGALSDTDALIEALEQLIAKKRHIKQGTMSQLLTGKKRLPGFKTKPGTKQTEIGEIPADWSIEQLGPMVNIISGLAPSQCHFYPEGVPYFKVEQLNNCDKYLKNSSLHVAVVNPIPVGSIIFPKRGASIYLNKIRITQVKSFIDTNLMALTAKENLCSEYLLYILAYFELWRIADTTSIPQINNKHILPLKIPLPPAKAEQEAIATVLSDMDTEIQALEAKLQKTRQLKQGMMAELLTGRIRLI